MFHFAVFRSRKRTRRSSPAHRAQSGVVRATMAKRPRVDDFTHVMPAVSDATHVLPATAAADPDGTVERDILSAPVPPAQRRYAELDLWAAPPASEQWPIGPVAEVHHDRQSRRFLTDLAVDGPFLGEASYPSLAAYDGPDRGVVHNAAVSASDPVVTEAWFRQGVCDRTRFDALMETFAVDRGVLTGDRRARTRPPGSMGTQVFAVVGRRQFDDDSTSPEGRNAS